MTSTTADTVSDHRQDVVRGYQTNGVVTDALPSCARISSAPQFPPVPMVPTELFRRIALSLDGVVEGEHMRHPDFRVHGKIFATIYPDQRHGMVKLPPDVQRDYVK